MTSISVLSPLRLHRPPSFLRRVTRLLRVSRRSPQLVIVSGSFRVIFLAVMVTFHILTLVLMEVSFIENLLLYIVLVDFSRFFERGVPQCGGWNLSRIS